MNDDLVSRQAVIDYLESISNMDPKERGAIIFSVELLPSAPQKTGWWAGTVCTACGESTSDYYNCDYCPRCGAKMEGEW